MQSKKTCVYRYTLLIPGKINMLRDDVLSMSVCHFQCQVLSSTCTTIQIYCAATSCRTGKELPTFRRAVPSPSARSAQRRVLRLLLLDCLTLKMKAPHHFSTSVPIYQSTPHNIQDFNRHKHRFDSLKPRMCTVFVLADRYQLINIYRITYTKKGIP
jgi:hypothetical protein